MPNALARGTGGPVTGLSLSSADVRARAAPANLGDRILRVVLRGAALSLVLLVVGMVAEMLVRATPAIRAFGFSFLYTSTWDPVAERFGAVPFVFGTLVSSLLALLIAVPLGLGAAIYLAELAPRWMRSPMAFLVELVAAVPSVVYGLWGIFVLAPLLRTWVQPALGKTLGFLPLFQGPPYGVGMLAAGIILAIMVVPFITAVGREVLLAVPNTQREAALDFDIMARLEPEPECLRQGRDAEDGLGQPEGHAGADARTDAERDIGKLGGRDLATR